MFGKTNHETPYFKLIRDSSYYGHSQISWLLISIPTWAPNVSRENNNNNNNNNNKQQQQQQQQQQQTNKQTNKQKTHTQKKTQ